MAIHSEKKWIALATDDHVIRLYRATDGAPGPTFKGHTEKITSLIFLPGAESFLSGSLDKSIRFWNLRDPEPSQILETQKGITALALVNREKPTEEIPIAQQSLVAGDNEKNLLVWS